MSIVIPPPMTPEEFFEDSRRFLDPPPYVSKYGRVKFRDIDVPGAEHEYIIDELFSVGDKSVIGGPSMSGKSFLAIHAAMSIARGTDFLGYKVLRPGLVIYQAGEGARGIKKRLRAYRAHFGVPRDEDVLFDLLTSKIDLHHAEGDCKPLIEECLAISKERGMPITAIFIDTLATASGAADENSGKDMAAVMGHIDQIERATGAHVCLVHHFNAAGTKLRGHSSIFANIDQVLQVTCNDATKVRTAVLAKQKDGESMLRLQFELKAIEIGHRKDDGKPITSCVVLPVGEKEAAKKTAEASGFALRPDEEPVFKAFMMAREKSGRFADNELEQAGVPQGKTAVHYRDWKAAYLTLGPCEADGSELSDDAVTKRLQRYKDKLMKFGIIGWARPWIWHSGKPVKGFRDTFPQRQIEPVEIGQPVDMGAEESPF